MPVSLNTLETIIREAGNIALDQFNDLQNLQVSQKKPRDFVTAADIAVEKFLKQALAEHYPEYGFWGEESGQTEDQAQRWIVDPIDGTHSFAKGQYFWSISVALEINGELILDQSVTGNSANEVYQSSVAASTLTTDGINDIFVKKNGTGPLYFDAHLISYLDPTQATRVEDGMIIVRKLYEVMEDGEQIPADTFRKGRPYLSELQIIVSEDHQFVALTDTIPAGMKVRSESLKQDELFNQHQLEDGQITYSAPSMPAGVYKVSTELQAVLGGTYLHLPATIQALFEPSDMSRTEGGVVQIID